jgi:hypothetical protein
LPAGWSEERLASLQREWEALDFFKALPEVTAFTRVSAAVGILLEREERLKTTVLPALAGSPRVVWDNVRQYLSQLGEIRFGSYQDEMNALRHFRDREREVRDAIQARTWRTMRELPAVTNSERFSPPSSPMSATMLNSRQIMLGAQMLSSPEGGQTLLGRAADAEARRRIIVTALALERFRTRHGSYPESLEKLVPEFIAAVPIDFMDGAPLRYQLAAGGNYLLYSLGLDCVDHGGFIRQPDSDVNYERWSSGSVQGRTEKDLVWPRAASDAEIEIAHAERKAASERRARFQEERAAEVYWKATAERQAQVEKILLQRYVKPAEPKVKGKKLSELLQVEETAVGVSMERLLTLKPVTTGAEPEVLTFELPIRFDALKKNAKLELFIDSGAQDSFETVPARHDYRPGTNGNTVIRWSTIYSAPGKHALHVTLYPNEDYSFDGNAEESGTVIGPKVACEVANLCQFAPGSERGMSKRWIARARALEPEASYRMRVVSPTGELLKSFEGSATNHVMVMDWDFLTEAGKEWEDNFDSVFEITLPASGRSQTLKGPERRIIIQD